MYTTKNTALSPSLNWLMEETDGHIEDNYGEEYFVIDRTTHGDYCGGMVERSNKEELVKDFPEWLEDTSLGAFNSWSATISAKNATRLRRAFRDHFNLFHNAAVNLIEALKGLSDYPCYNDEHWSQLEYEIISGGLAEKIQDTIKYVCQTHSIDEDNVNWNTGFMERISELLRENAYVEQGENIAWENEDEAEKFTNTYLEGWIKNVKDDLGIMVPEYDNQQSLEHIEEIRRILETVQFGFEAKEAIQLIQQLVIIG